MLGLNAIVKAYATRLHLYSGPAAVKQACDFQAAFTGICLHSRLGWLFNHELTPYVLYVISTYFCLALLARFGELRVTFRYPSWKAYVGNFVLLGVLAGLLPLLSLLAKDDYLLVFLLYSIPLVIYTKIVADNLQLYQPKSGQSLRGKVVIVTGANTGIGFATAQSLARHGATTILACRNPQKGLAAIHKINFTIPVAHAKFMELDLNSLDSVRAFADQFIQEYGELDILINNAGFYAAKFSTTAEGFESGIGAMHFGHFLLTELLRPYIKDGGRVVNVASGLYRAGDISRDSLVSDLRGEKIRDGIPSYARAKLANVLFSNELQHRMIADRQNLTSIALHPGLVASDIWTTTILRPLIDAVSVWNRQNEHAARVVLYAALSDDINVDTQFVSSGCYPVPVTGIATDQTLAEDLWDVSTELTGLGQRRGRTTARPSTKTSATPKRRATSKSPARRGRTVSKSPSRAKTPRKTASKSPSRQRRVTKSRSPRRR